MERALLAEREFIRGKHGSAGVANLCQKLTEKGHRNLFTSFNVLKKARHFSAHPGVLAQAIDVGLAGTGTAGSPRVEFSRDGVDPAMASCAAVFKDPFGRAVYSFFFFV